jgi:hypothetical protein
LGSGHFTYSRHHRMFRLAPVTVAEGVCVANSEEVDVHHVTVAVFEDVFVAAWPPGRRW